MRRESYSKLLSHSYTPTPLFTLWLFFHLFNACSIFLLSCICLHYVVLRSRDLKPENIMLRTKDDVSEVVVIDLGLSRNFVPGQKITSRVGSCYYSSPEIQTNTYDESCDLWSLGVVVYVMLCSYPPFDGADDRAVYDAVQKCTFKYKRLDWDRRSLGGPALINQLLALDPSQRPTPTDVLNNAWVKAGARHQQKLVLKKARAVANGQPFIINRFGQLDQWATDTTMKYQNLQPAEKEVPAVDLEIEVVAEIPKGTSLDDESVKADSNKTAPPVANKKKGWF